MIELIKQFLALTEMELDIGNYAERTKKAYLRCISEYFWSQHGDVALMQEGAIKAFLWEKKKQNLAPETLNMYLNAIKFFYVKVLKIDDRIDIRMARRNKRAPIVLGKGEILRIISALRNFKHRLMVALAYGAGLRVSEVVNLQVGELDFERGLIWVRQGKGGKDRMTLLPSKLVDDIRTFVKGCEKSEYVFPSPQGGKLTTRTPQKIFQNALEKAQIQKKATFHSLRHSFATHLIENGTSIRYIQALLGHRNIRTTQRYTQVTKTAIENIESPL